MHSDIQHWIEVSVECDVPAAVIPPPTTCSRIDTEIVRGRLGELQRLSGYFGRKQVPKGC